MSVENISGRDPQRQPALEAQVVKSIGDMLSVNAAVSAYSYPSNGVAQCDIENATARTPNGSWVNLSHEVRHTIDKNGKKDVYVETLAMDRDQRGFAARTMGDNSQIKVVGKDKPLEGPERTSFLEGVLNATVDVRATEQTFAFLSSQTTSDNDRLLYLRDLSSVNHIDDINKIG